MELFTLGHGNGYSETDVREGARALTGWGIGPSGRTAVMSDRYDSGSKTILGVSGNLDHEGFCDAVIGRPECAAFVTARLWRQLASDDPPSVDTVDRLTAAYGPQHDLKALTKAILLDPAFTASRGTIVSTPIEWLVGVARTVKAPLDSPELIDPVLVALTVMGQRPFYPPDVNGWPRGKAWLSTTSATARAWAADKFTTLGDLSIVEDAATGDRIDATGYLIGIGAWSDRSVAGLKDLVRNPRRLVSAAVNTPEYLTA
jgi:uncharacterized protein (DUF1800 family)